MLLPLLLLLLQQQSFAALCERKHYKPCDSGSANQQTPVLQMLNRFIASPHLTTGVPTIVTIGIYVNAFDSVSVESMDYSVQIFLRLSWQDARLAYNASANPGSAQTGLTVDPRFIDEIWLPDIIFVNEKQARYHDITIPNKLLRVWPNGSVYFSSRVSLRLGCQMALYKFPLDQQVCDIYMESYRFTKHELQLKWREQRPFEMNEKVHLPQFTLTNWSVSNCDMLYISGEYPCLRVQFSLKRVFAVYLIQYYVPSTLIVILSWVSFWINIEAVPARISLGVMTVLSMTTQSMGLWMTLPKASYIKAIDIWMGVTVLYVFSAMLEFALVNTLARNEIRRVATRVRRAARERNGACNGSSSGYRKQLHGKHVKTRFAAAAAPGADCSVDDHSPFIFAKKLMNEYTYGDWKSWDPHSRQVARKIDKTCRLLFPMTFLIFFVIYWSHFIF